MTIADYEVRIADIRRRAIAVCRCPGAPNPVSIDPRCPHNEFIPELIALILDDK